MKYQEIKILDINTGEYIYVPPLVADSIILNYNGGDEKYVPITPTELRFQMIDVSNTPEKYSFLVSEPNRYKVELWVVYDDGTYGIYWQGFITSSEYEENIEYRPTISIIATDNIASLKNINIAEPLGIVNIFDLYREILDATGLIGFDIVYIPAIVNTVTGATGIMIDKSKLQDKNLYEILEILNKSLLVNLYLKGNKWYLEGWNVRNRLIVESIRIQANGNQFNETITRGTSEFQFATTPYIKKEFAFAKVEVKEKEYKYDFEGLDTYEIDYVSSLSTWSIPALKWWGNNIPAEVLYQSGNQYTGHVLIDGNDTLSPDNHGYIQFYARKDTKLKFSVILRSAHTGDVVSDADIRFRIAVNGNDIFANYSTSSYALNDADLERIIYDAEQLKFDYEWIMKENGYVEFYVEPKRDVFVEKLDVKASNYTHSTILTNDRLGINESITLDAYPNESLNGISLITENDESFANVITVDIPIQKVKDIDGYRYVFVSVQGAELIKKYPDNVYWNGEKINPLDYIYNYLGGEQVVVIFSNQNIDTSNPIKVYTHSWNTAYGTKDTFQKWKDAFYGIGEDTFLNIYSQIIFWLKNKEYNLIDGNIYGIVDYDKFFLYNGKRYRPTNISINLTKEETDIVMHETAYRVNGNENHPPYLYVEPDVILDAGVTSTQLVAQAVDVDGSITGIQWTELTFTGVTIDSPNSLITNVSNITDDVQMNITVTDNDGASASGQVNILLKKSLQASISIVSVDYEDCKRHSVYRLDIDGIRDGDVFLIDTKLDAPQVIYFAIKKNGVIIAEKSGIETSVQLKITIEYGDVLEYYFEWGEVVYDDGTCSSNVYDENIYVYSAEVIEGVDEITNLPLSFNENG